MSNYSEEHWKAAKHLLKYLQGTHSLGLIYSNVFNPYPLFKAFSSNPTIHVYTNSDWAQSKNQKSMSSFIIEMGGGVIAWSSKQQTIVALSSCEAEYITCTHAAKQILWLQSLAQELGFIQTNATPLYCDNQGTVACALNPQHHSRMKHIDIRYHFIWDCVQRSLINVMHIPGVDNISDILTKPLH
jgi:hypothetical protein